MQQPRPSNLRAKKAKRKNNLIKANKPKKKNEISDEQIQQENEKSQEFCLKKSIDWKEEIEIIDKQLDDLGSELNGLIELD